MIIETYGSGSSGNCYRLTHQRQSIILDAGVSYSQLIKNGFSIKDVNALLVTHQHNDHCKAVDDFIKRGITVYMSNDTRKALGLKFGFYVKQIEAGQSIKFKGWYVKAFELEHDVPNIGFYVRKFDETLIYITDSFYCKYRFKDINYIMLEINHSKASIDNGLRAGYIHPALYKRLRTSHFSLENALNFLKACDLSQLKEVRILHLSDNNGDAELFKEEVQRLTGVYVNVER